MPETLDTRASRRAAATASASPSPRPRRRFAILGGTALLGVLLTAGLIQAPSALADLASAPTDVQIRKSTNAAEEAGIALTNAVALNNVVAASGLDVAQPAVDITELKADARALADPDELEADRLTALTASAAKETREVLAGIETLQTALTEAQQAEAARIAAEKAKAAAEEAARIKAEKEAAAAAALAAANTVEGAKATARDMAASRYGWGDGQFSCLESLWTKESGWNYQAYNGSSGATGIPQALPGDKMASAGADWRTNAATQIAWGLEYIAAAYGSPCNAWGHSQAVNWY
ncbi:phospholipase [Microbacterium sp.]|uniref:aggregation-promoting factor C-terminal-like domain-containing protein n=1 Tax=Microbacterium sp. TaxID=51671 RepID=UPI00281254DB|nr:phospholipase [Microbacterium sp.]